MKRCICCRETYDDQFVSKYETLDHEKQFLDKSKQFITLCEFCWEEHSEFDNDLNLPYIMFGNDFYPSSQIL